LLALGGAQKPRYQGESKGGVTPVLLLFLVVWASARLYYFMFYVIERYIDPSYRFTGIGSALRYMLVRSANRMPPGPGDT
jgi:hypothetical protein